MKVKDELNSCVANACTFDFDQTNFLNYAISSNNIDDILNSEHYVILFFLMRPQMDINKSKINKLDVLMGINSITLPIEIF